MLPMMLRSVEMMSSVGTCELAAVADDVVRAAGRGHREALVLRALLGDEVEHDVGARAVGQLLHGGDLRAVGDDRVVRAELLGQLQRVRVAVDDDDLRRGERGQALDADVAEPAGADHARRSCPGRAAAPPCGPRGRR